MILLLNLPVSKCKLGKETKGALACDEIRNSFE